MLRKKSKSLVERSEQFMRRHGAKSLEDFGIKFAGFWTETDADILGAEVFDNPSDFVETAELNEAEKEKIIAYLDSGEMIFAITLSLTDDDGSNIGPYMIHTNGSWMWPSHFSFYLKKSGFTIMKNEFLTNIREQNYLIPPMSEEQKSKAKGFFEILVGKKWGYL